ncbi:MAG: family 78 glycoside hydrolase catalytic domain [Planctomycetota bacterium]
MPGFPPLLLALASCLTSAPAVADDPAAPARLRCESLSAPLGVDERRPRFSWEVIDPRRGALQSAYELVVTLVPGSGEPRTVWESGRIESSETCQVEYAGSPLESFRRYAWKVRTYDAEGRSSPWSESSFGTGALDPADWVARWIGDAVAVEPPQGVNDGYHSQFASAEDDAKWIQIDLGQDLIFNQFRLHPAQPHDGSGPPGYLFPLQIKIWMDSVPSFSKTFTKIAERTYQDIPDPGTEPLEIRLEHTKMRARYVRLGITKLRGTKDRGFAFALAEFQILLDGLPISTGMPVTVSDSLESGGWSSRHLVDGDTVSHGTQGIEPLPAPMLRRDYLVATPLARATLFASALGLQEIRMNGRRVGEDQLAPGWTDYSVRVPYLAYDVTELVRVGRNAITAQLADGWYAGRLGLAGIVPGGLPRAIYGRKPRFLAQLELELADGTRQTVATDATWRSTLHGPLQVADLLDGETYDATSERAEFHEPGFDDSRMAAAEIDQALAPRLEFLACEPAKIVQELRPVAVREPKPGVFVFDLGQNMVGWCRLKLRAPRGNEIVLRHGEMAEPDGSIYTANLRGAAQTDRYVARGAEEGEVFEPRFTVHGFRYVEVTGLPATPDVADLTGCVVSIAAERAGTFEASDPLLGRLWTNIDWSLRGNVLSVPTDCPQRDERLGWMGDIAVFAQTGAFLRDLGAFFSKWIPDVRDAQASDGRYPDFAPHPFGKDLRFTGTPAWGDAGVIVPWTAYLNYADRRLVREHLDSMIRWLEWIRSRNPDLVWRKDRGNDYGDWLNGDTLVREGWPKQGASTPGELLATAHFAHSAELVARMAAAVGRAEDAGRYAELARGIREAFRKAFVAEDGTLLGGSQGACALALAFDLLTEEQQGKALDRLEQGIVQDYGGHLSTGFTSTLPALLELSRRGRTELATKLVLDKTFPSWGYAIEQGATTIWERWDGFVPERGLQDAGMNSFNHYAFGAVGEWMMRMLAGIEPDPEHPGWARFSIHPRAGPQLSFVRAEHHTIRGKIASAWKREGGSFHLDVTIPPNTRAKVFLPARDVSSVTEGGRPLAEAGSHVRFVEMRGGEAVLDVAAGSYRFAGKP